MLNKLLLAEISYHIDFDIDRCQPYLLENRILEKEFDNYYSFFKDNSVSVCFMDFYCIYDTDKIKCYNNNVLLLSFSKLCESEFAPLKLKQFEDEGTTHDEILSNLSTISYLAYVIMYIVYQMETGRAKKKSSRRWYSLYKTKIDNTPIEVRKYRTGKEDVIIEKKQGENKVVLFDNSYRKTVKNYPSDLYPMPNNNEIVYFHEGNTTDFEDDEVSNLLDKVNFKFGRCHDNSQNVYNLLFEGNYTKEHDVSYYCGWIYTIRAGASAFHAWIVVDGKHIIDLTNAKIDKMFEYENSIINGEHMDFSKEKLADWVYEHSKLPIPFKEKYFYGTAADKVYIGVKSCYDEFIKTYDRLNTAEHPEYVNIRKGETENETTRIFHSKYPS